MIAQQPPRDVAARLDSDDPPFLLDVREPSERQLASIDAAHHIPMGDVAGRLDEISRDRDVVVHCHHGGRSQQVAELLKRQGYERVANLDGGIDRWSTDVDPEIPRYT